MNDANILSFMDAALHEGRKALPNCLPNPPVGCVIVKDGIIVSRGHTNDPGCDHAEAMALNGLPADLREYVAFVTLEPCSFYGRTPSCAQTLASRRIGHVYVALIDPDPRNSGKGIELLRENGVDVTVGVLSAQAWSDLSPYLNQDQTP